MTIRGDCPDDSLLHQLASGTISPEMEGRLSTHLDCCSQCQSRLEQAAMGGQDLEVVASHLKGSEQLTESLKRVISNYHPTAAADLPDSSRRKAASSRLEHLLMANSDPVRQSERERTIGPGERLGEYVIMKEIGRGGMGVVWKAWDPDRDRFVAIKVLECRITEDETARRRFLREARVVSQVNHRNVVAVFEAELSPVPYLVMEFVDGPSLRSHLLKKGSLELTQVLRIGVHIACGLAALHEKGVVHRDIKPANIVLDRASGRAKVADFGLAQGSGDSRLTSVGFVAGTPSYMSPEQAMGDSVDYRSDLFSLGSVLFAMVSGQSPFGDAQTFNALDRVRNADPIPLQSINPEIPQPLIDLIGWMHARHPDDRPESASVVADHLRRQLKRLN